MKKLFVLALCLCVLTSCKKTQEEKIKDLIAVEMNKSLLYPDSYEATEIKIDSAFAPADSPELFETIVRLGYIAQQLENCEENISNAEKNIAIWNGGYSAYFRQEQKEAQKKYDKAVEEKKNLEKQIEKLQTKLSTLSEQERKFIGFKVKHSFRAKNNDGNVILGEYSFLINDNSTEVIWSMDHDSKDYMIYDSIIEYIKNQNE